ncbi:MAG: DUF58 domain-containing protein [Betaproteobacteria bacterium]|nr:DUF58 domain-containing protein [Betaproteobacteria bacterium]MCC6249652.1 DUF58 domain-containing protein [Rubrivivax sp.]MCL4697807.1 DUF58 domain-containing protein [Burkholderiaceae bacterium]
MGATGGRWWQALSPAAQFRRWWQARLPLTDTWVLGQRNIYILPTRAGVAFTLTLLVMLLAAINYQLNLGFALTFALAGAGMVSMHLTHGNLRGLTLHLRPPASGFAGEAAPLEVVLTNPGRMRYGLALRFEGGPGAGAADNTAVDTKTSPAGRGFAWCDVSAGGQQTTHLAFVPPARGWHAVPTLVVETVFPFGLFRAWTVWRPAARVLAWPRPEEAAPPLPASAAAPGAEARRATASEGGEFDGVRPWRRGDTMRQVVWKKVARSNELVSRETTGSGRREVWLDWAGTALNGTEPRLARLAAWVLAADRAGLPYGLRLPARELPPAAGAAHRLAALDTLALWR